MEIGAVASTDIPPVAVSSRTLTFFPLRGIGLGHLFYDGTGALGRNEESTELRVACFMGLVSFLSSRVEVLRVSPRHGASLLNAVARPMIQSATLTESPLTAAGLDGTGQVVQVRVVRSWQYQGIFRSVETKRT